MIANSSSLTPRLMMRSCCVPWRVSEFNAPSRQPCTTVRLSNCTCLSPQNVVDQVIGSGAVGREKQHRCLQSDFFQRQDIKICRPVCYWNPSRLCWPIWCSQNLHRSQFWWEAGEVRRCRRNRAYSVHSCPRKTTCGLQIQTSHELDTLHEKVICIRPLGN